MRILLMYFYVHVTSFHLALSLCASFKHVYCFQISVCVFDFALTLFCTFGQPQYVILTECSLILFKHLNSPCFSFCQCHNSQVRVSTSFHVALALTRHL